VKRNEKPLLHLFPKTDPDTGKRWTLTDQGNAVLNEVCDSLNSETHRELRSHLRAWIEAWQASGPNLKKLFGGLPEPQRMALRVAMRTIWNPRDDAKGELLFVPDYPELEKLLGEQRVWLKRADNKRELTPEVEAMTLFHLLTVTPGCEKVAGPCRRCDRYYIKKRASQNVYCSRRCGNAATAVLRTTERLAKEREDKLERAGAAIKTWSRAATRQDWKRWVANKTGIDLRFLTRAVTKGDLMPPKLER
jgi:hypothetical protein